MPETRVPSLSQEHPLEKRKATHSSSCLDNPMHREAWQATVHRIAESDTAQRLTLYYAPVKDRNSINLKEAEDIKKMWQEYTELHKKILMTQRAMMV